MKIELEGDYTHERAVLLPTFEPKSLTVTISYYKDGDGYVVVTERNKPPVGVEVHELECVLDVEGMFGGPLVYFHDKGGKIFFTKRPFASVSLAIHLPEGGVSARDGIGDWNKSFSLSVPDKKVDCT